MSQFPSSASEESDSSVDDDLEGEEIWDSSDDEAQPEVNKTFVAERILQGIALFLTKFQLTFRIPERAMLALLVFLKTLLMFLSNMIRHSLVIEVYHLLPRTMWKIKSLAGACVQGGTEYVVCCKCHSLYSLSDCSIVRNNKRVFLEKLCTHIEYPNHPHHSRRMKCSTPLMKQVKAKGISKFVPRKLYLYNSIIKS